VTPLAATRYQARTTITAAEPAISTVRTQGEGLSANRLKAIPGLRLCTRYRKLCTSSRRQPSTVLASRAAFETRSSRTAGKVSASQRSREAWIIAPRSLELGARRPPASWGVSFDLLEGRRTTLAHRRIAAVFADAGRVVPAALALAPLGGQHSHGQTGQ